MVAAPSVMRMSVRAWAGMGLLERQLSAEEDDVFTGASACPIECRALVIAVNLHGLARVPVEPERQLPGLPARARRGKRVRKHVAVHRQLAVPREQLQRAPVVIDRI